MHKKHQTTQRSILSTSIFEEKSNVSKEPPAVDAKDDGNAPQTQSVLSPLSPNVKKLTDELSDKYANRPNAAEMKEKGLVDPNIVMYYYENYYHYLCMNFIYNQYHIDQKMLFHNNKNKSKKKVKQLLEKRFSDKKTFLHLL